MKSRGKTIVGVSGISVLMLVPAIAQAAPGSFRDLVTLLVDLVNNSITPLIFAIALLTFIYGVFQYFFSPDNPENIKKGKQVIIWGIVALAVMVSIWGILNLLQGTFFLGLSCLNNPVSCYGPF